MGKILTVDDSRAVRMLVGKQARELGLEVVEAEDGQQALARIAEDHYDIIVLDITMPVLDGPAFLAELRQKGDLTPVLMLTSESKRSIVTTLMKLGIDDFILKPFKAEELKAKIAKVLAKVLAKSSPGSAAPTAAAAATDESAVAGAEPAAGAKPTVDILVVDDMENVQKRLRSMIPEAVSLRGVTTAHAALTAARDRTFRLIMIDNDIPSTDSTSLMRQLRVVQPQAAFVSLSLRTVSKAQEEARAAGFEATLFKPFDQVAMDELLQRFFDNQELLVIKENVLAVAPFSGRETKLPSYFGQVSGKVPKAVEEMAAACFADVVVDIAAMPVLPEQSARLVLQIKEHCRRVGMEMRLVGSLELQRVLRQLADTADVPVYASVSDAQSGNPLPSPKERTR
ncbi:MAG TPA: response regulator [Polyangia bacterium]|nr:response regulator [Polyangia bacterium]